MLTSDFARERSRRRAIASFALGVVGLLGFLWLWLITATDLDPPEWVRIAGVWLMPIGIVGAVATGESSRRGAGRPWAIAGITLAVITVVAAALLLFLWPQ